jgi:polysaccharide transporter, PST family
VSFGATAVAAALAGTGLLLRAPLAFWLATRRGPVSLAHVWAALLPSLAAGGVAAVAVAVRRFLLPDGLPPVEGLPMAVVTAAAAAMTVFVVVPKSRRALAGLRGVGRLLLRSA